MSNAPPSAPGGKPVVGHTLSLLRSPLATLEAWGATDDSVVSVDVAGRSMVLVTDPSLLRAVLGTDADKYRKAELVRERLGTLQGNSLVLLEGAEWRRRRETVQSAFTPEQVAGTDSVTTRYSAEMVDSWPGNGTVRVDEHARDVSLAILAQTLFGLELRGAQTPVHEAADDILARMDLRSVSTYLPEWVPTPTNHRFARAVEAIHERLDATVARRTASDPVGDDLLSTMVRAGMASEQIRDELVAFLFAGFDSTATALSCTLGLLADHPAVQSDLRTALDACPGDGSPTSAALEDVALLDAVIRESLRLYPPQYLLFREPTTAVTLGEYHIPAGTTVVLPPWVCHRDERFWTEPETFRPERWLDSAGADRPSYAYFPFGGGPRHCVGRRLAMRILQRVVAEVCTRRRLELVGDISVSAGPTLSLRDGIAVRVRPR
jgi:cytochrome P450